MPAAAVKRGGWRYSSWTGRIGIVGGLFYLTRKARVYSCSCFILIILGVNGENGTPGGEGNILKYR